MLVLLPRCWLQNFAKYLSTVGAGVGDIGIEIADPQGKNNTVEIALEDKGNCVYRCTYKPVKPGTHNIGIAFGGEVIPKSPYVVNVGERKYHTAV